jgi:hypothetical protein
VSTRADTSSRRPHSAAQRYRLGILAADRVLPAGLRCSTQLAHFMQMTSSETPLYPFSFTIYQGCVETWSEWAREPDVVALETLLRVCGVPDSAVQTLSSGTPYMTDRLVFPVLHIRRNAEQCGEAPLQDFVVSGWYACRGLLLDLGVLSPGQCTPVAESLVSLVRDRLDLGRLYEWWHIDANYSSFTKRYWSTLYQLPWMARWTMPRQERDAVRTRLLMQSAAYRQVLRRTRPTSSSGGATFRSPFPPERRQQQGQERDLHSASWSDASAEPAATAGEAGAAALEAAADAEFWSLEIEPVLDALAAMLGEHRYFQCSKTLAPTTTAMESQNGPTTAPGYVDAVVYGHLLVYLQMELPVASRLRALVAQRPTLQRYVARMRDTHLHSCAEEQSGAAERVPPRVASAGDLPRPHPSHASWQATGSARSSNRSKMSSTPEEDAAQERQLANRTFVWLAVGSFIFYALFGTALDVRIGDSSYDAT